MALNEPPKTDRRQGRLSSVSAAVRLLKMFSGDEAEIGISEMAKRLNVAKSTAHRLAVTLMAEDLLDQNPETGRYRLGLGLFTLGSLVRHRMDLATAARTLLMELRDDSNETVLLAVPIGNEAMYILNLDSLHAVRTRTYMGVHVPLYCTAAGRAILAFLPEDRLSALLAAPMPKHTLHTVTEPEKLRRMLADVRRLGYAVEDEESDVGIRAIGTPVFTAGGRVVGSIAVAGPTQRMSMKRINTLVEPVMLTAQQISMQLGYRAPMPVYGVD